MIEEHRVLSELDSLIESGINQIFFYGDGANDYFLYNFHMGIRELENTLKYYFIEKNRFDNFIKIGDKKIVVFDKNLNKINLMDAFNIQKIKGGFASNKTSSQTDSRYQTMNNAKAEEIRESASSTADENNRIYLLENIDKKSFLIFLDDFDWKAKLYDSQPNLELIKFLKDIRKSKNSTSIVKMSDPLLLKKYGFEIDLKNDEMLFIPKPSSTELIKVIRRFCLNNNLEMEETALEDIAMTIKSNKKTLREVIRILKKFKKIGVKKITLENFEAILKPSIDEKVTFDDVIIPSSDKDKIKSIVETFLKNPTNAQKGILLYGPPGTGKTHIARAIANEFKMYYSAPTLAELKGEFVGQSAKNIKKLFDDARANEPTIMFLDEIDTIFRKRGGGNTDSYTEDMVNQFLVEIDGVKSGKSRVFLVGATNRLDEIDPAIKSRLSQQFYIGLPNRLSREKIIAKRFKQFDFINCDFKDEFLDKTEGLSGRDLDGLTKAIKERGEENYLNRNDFFVELQQFEKSFIANFKDKMGGNLEIKQNPSITFNDIVGNEHIIRSLQDEINFIKMDRERKEQMKAFGLNQRRGTILYGPPGNGKTTFAEALAGENNFYFIKVISKDFTSVIPEETIKKINLIFQLAITLSKITHKDGVVLFFDEIDSLLGEKLDLAVRGSILKYFEDKKGIRADDSKIILIAATNHFNMLDRASIREGRFDNKLEIKNPTSTEKVEIFKKLFENDKHLELSVDDNYFEKILEPIKNKEISIAFLKTLKEEIKKEAFMNGHIIDNKIIISE